MEFRYRAGEERDSAPMGYFANQALRVGIGLGNSNPVPPMISRGEALMEELRREQIREELLAREIANKRMLEEGIRRELELERQMAMRRFEEERFLQMEMEPRVRFSEIPGPGFGQRYPEIREDRRTPPIYRDIRVDEGSGSQHREGVDIKRTSSRERGFGVKKGPNKPFVKPEFVGTKNKFLQNKASDHKLSGSKRKADSELPRPPLKEWSCSLCGVSATCQKNLSVHLHGKKHKAKLEEIAEKKAAASKRPKPNVPNVAVDVPLQVKAAAKKNDKEAKAAHHSQKSRAVWCGLCKVKCNSAAMLDCHLKGKKHLLQLEAKKGGAAAAAGASVAPTKGTEDNGTR